MTGFSFKFSYYLCLFSFFLLTTASVLKDNHHDFSVTVKGIFKVIYTQPDSLYASQSIHSLMPMFDEISTDLNITKIDTIQILICPDRRFFNQITFGTLPKWIEGLADVHSNTMIIKSPRWDRTAHDFSRTLIHELTHLLFHQAVNGKPIPRWLDEGIAIFYSKEKEWATATQISKALLTRSIIPLNDIDKVLNFHREKAKLAYQESYTAVQYMLEMYDIYAIQGIIDGIRTGKNWDEIFINSTGSSFQVFEKEWYNHINEKYKWYFLSEFDSFIWIIILSLFIAVFVILKFRNRRTIKEWGDEGNLEE